MAPSKKAFVRLSERGSALRFSRASSKPVAFRTYSDRTFYPFYIKWDWAPSVRPSYSFFRLVLAKRSIAYLVPLLCSYLTYRCLALGQETIAKIRLQLQHQEASGDFLPKDPVRAADPARAPVGSHAHTFMPMLVATILVVIIKSFGLLA